MGAILVTGGAGFIGSHVADLLIARGHKVHVLDDLSKGRRENIHAKAVFHEVDIVSGEEINKISSSLPSLDAIVHCAAQASVTASTSNPAFDLTVNIAGTINVLEIASQHHCPLVFTSTGGAIYGEEALRPTPETSPVAPGAPYGASKAAAEIYVQLWAKRDGLSHTICRLANVYGPRQRGDGEAGVVSIFANRLSKGKAVTLYGYGTPSRDYVHVSDVALALVSTIGHSGVFNIGTGVETSVARIYELVVEGLGVATSESPELLPLRPGELAHSCLAIDRARVELEWWPVTDIASGVRSTAREITGI